MDREGDIQAVLFDIHARGDGALIRCKHNRGVTEPLTRAHEAVRAAPVLGTVVLDLPRAHDRPARTAQVEIRALPMRLTAYIQTHQVTMTLIEVWEPSPPPGVSEPLHWLLWTTEPAQTLAEAQICVEFYKLRWRIEEYHLVLKSGCRIEELQFENLAHLKKALAIYCPVAARIVALRDAARVTPEAPCTTMLQDIEWRTLWTVIHNRAPQPELMPPSLRQAVLWIGRLGGHMNRKGDGMPGVRTLWRGWCDLMLMIRAVQAVFNTT
jgi:hypothetical protein